jgi:mono/diheme cytochrome c family protein
MKPTLLLRSLLLAIALVGCDNQSGNLKFDDLPGKPKLKDQPIPADENLNYTTLYAENCAACHGREGKMGPAPPLKDPLFQALVSEKEIQRIITEGRPGTPMPSFASGGTQPGGSQGREPIIARTPTGLTPRQIEVLARGIKIEWKAAKEIPGLPPYQFEESKGSTSKGKAVWMMACAPCHGKEGKEPRMTINDPNFLALISNQALRRIIITGRPDLGMPSFQENIMRGDDFKPLTAPQIDDLLALLISWKQGSAEGK